MLLHCPRTCLGNRSIGDLLVCLVRSLLCLFCVCVFVCACLLDDMFARRGYCFPPPFCCGCCYGRYDSLGCGIIVLLFVLGVSVVLGVVVLVRVIVIVLLKLL